MKKSIIASFIAIGITAGTACAVDLAEIQKLKDMGFTNEQIVEMTKNSNNTNTAQPGVSQQRIDHINSAKQNKKGILVLCVSKEFPDRGPGYIEVYKNNEKIGSIELSEYVSNGPSQQSKSDYYEFNKKNKMTSGTTTTTVANTICSRYFGEFELPAGTYEIKLERKLYMGDPTSEIRFKSKKHKKFHKVAVEEGKVTLLSYYWEDNENFGKDIVVSGNHKAVLNDVANAWGEYLLKVIEK